MGGVLNGEKAKEASSKDYCIYYKYFVIFISITYALVNVTVSGTKRQVITAGDLSLILEENENNLTIENAFPLADEVGMIQEDVFTFRLINNSPMEVGYILKLVDITTGGNKLSTSDVKYYLTKDGKGTPALLSELEDGVVDSGLIKGNQVIHYSLRLWLRYDITDDTTVVGKNLSYRIDVDVVQNEPEEGYVDGSGANIPELASGMIPVTYDEGEKSWVKADINEAWYDYEAQMWANAVTVTENTRDTYTNAEAGTTISMNDINTMWVWIPRYEYQYTNLGNQYAGGTQDLPGEIKVNFISASQTSPSNPEVYKIPEGFTFGGEELSGFWVGKFETGGTMSASCTSEACTTADLMIKPSVISLRNQSVSSFFYASRSMQNSSNANKYGFDTIGNGTMDVHMGKNTEWGIVAMLSQSKYGKYGNPSYSGADKEVAINNCSNYVTGIGGDSVSAGQSSTTCTTNTYETEKGQAASTTGNIYGVYDMSGGATEYVMGNYNNITASSGFSSFPDEKYYDLYTSTNASTGYKVGDATYETSGWYRDSAHFVNSSYPWFRRGGNYSNTTNAGVFNSSSNNGQAYTTYSARLFIKP